MKREKKGIIYKLDLTYDNVKFSATTVSLPIKGVQLNVGFWMEDLSTDDIRYIKQKYHMARKLLVKNIDQNVFYDKFIHILDYPENIITKKSYIGWTFHFYTKPEQSIQTITPELQTLCDKLFKEIIQEIERV